MKAPKVPGKKPKKTSAPIVDSLATALSLLNYFTVRDPELSLQQLSEKSGLYKSRIHRLCGTLVVSGFLVRMPWATYRLGPKLMTLGKIYENTNSLITISRPIMKELANLTGESVALFILDGETSYCLAREYGSSRLVFSIQEGDTIQLHASAAGKILLAYGSEELRKTVLGKEGLETFTTMTVIDPKQIKNELSRIRKCGYAVNKGERELEVGALAAPIFNHAHMVNATLAVVGPVQRFSDDRIENILQNLQDATFRISELIGASF
jgi:DNA-binding IclR family transcriptional regulator